MKRGRIVALNGQDATLEMEDGESRVVSVPDMIDVGLGTTAQVVDTGDGAPVIVWGARISSGRSAGERDSDLPG